MATATVTKPAAKPAVGQRKPVVGQKKTRKPLVKRTMVEYREALLEKKAKILQQTAIRVGKIDAKVVVIDQKYASRIAASEAKKAALAEGKTVAELNAELTAQIKELQATRRFLEKV